MIKAIFLYFIFSAPLILFYLERKERKRLKLGEELINWMTCWPFNQMHFYCIESGERQDGKGYKFYTSLVNEILFFQRELGGYPKKNFQVIKKALLGDLRFEKKVDKEMRGSFFQSLFLGVVTWLFISGSHKILGSKISIGAETLLSILCFQIMGVLLFQILCGKIKQKDFYYFDLYYDPLFRFFSLNHLDLPVGVVLEKSGLEVFDDDGPMNWKPVIKDLRNLIEKWKCHGVEIRNDLDGILKKFTFSEI